MTTWDVLKKIVREKECKENEYSSLTCGLRVDNNGVKLKKKIAAITIIMKNQKISESHCIKEHPNEKV